MDFLTFKSFISTEVLIVFYYIGAIILPVGAWCLVAWLIQTYELVNIAYEKGKDTLWNSLNKKQTNCFFRFLPPVYGVILANVI